jgi:hypothetical protein
MAQTSFALMTNVGRAKEAAALANATTIEITNIAIGDGATVPSGGETALYHQIALKTISGHGTVIGAANVAYFDCYLAAAEGPYTIREAGLYDIDGDLIAIAHYDPPINKPTPASGQTVEGTVRLEVAFSDVASVTIKVDPSMQVALQRLTRLPWIPVVSMTLTVPPALPVVGDTYVIAGATTGAWAGQAGKIAEYTNAGWAIIAPPDGHGIGLPDGRIFIRVSGAYIEWKAAETFRGGVTLSELRNIIKTTRLPGVIARASAALIPDSIVTLFGGWADVSNELVSSTFNATTGKLTVGATEDGWWMLMAAATVDFGSPSAMIGTEGVYILVNGILKAYNQAADIGFNLSGFSTATIIKLAVGDEVSAGCYHTLGSSRPIDLTSSFFNAVRLPSATVGV